MRTRIPRARTWGRGGAGNAREAGHLLLEMMIALTILSVGVMGFLFASQANLKASRDISTNDLVAANFANAVETLESADFLSLFSTYNNTTIPNSTNQLAAGDTTIGELVDETGSPAQVYVSFDVDETTLPAAYGPVADLDGDGAMNTADITAAGTYYLLPARLTLTYVTASGVETRQMYVLFSAD